MCLRVSPFLLSDSVELGMSWFSGFGGHFVLCTGRVLGLAQVVHSQLVVSCACGEYVPFGFPALDEAPSLQPAHGLEPDKDLLDASSSPLACETATGFAAVDSCDVLRDSELLQLLRLLHAPIAPRPPRALMA